MDASAKRGHWPLPEAATKGSVEVTPDAASPRPAEIASPRTAPTPILLDDDEPRGPLTNEELLEITAVQRPARTAAPLPFRAPDATDDAIARVKTLIAGSPAVRREATRTPPAGAGAPGGRQMTQELVVDPVVRAGLAGPAWLEQSDRPPAPAPAAPALVEPPPLQPRPRAPVVAPASLSAASASALEAPAPVPAMATAMGAANMAVPPLMALSATGPIMPLVAPRGPSAPPEVVKLGDVDARALGSATAAGVLAASNAAARARSEPPRKAAVVEPLAAEPRADGGGYLELLWLDKAAVPELRAHQVFGAWMKPPPKGASPQQGKPPPPPPSPESVEKVDRDGVHNILSKDPEAATDPKKAEDGEGDSAAPIVLVQGLLSFPFDRGEVLKAVMAAAKPLAAADKKLKEAIDLAAEALKADYDAVDAFEPLTARIREAWTRANRSHPPGHLDSRAEQALLEKRKYQKRTLLDGEWIRALLGPSAADCVVVYVPAKLEKRLPLFARFPVKMLCRLHPQQDADESSQVALEVIALARSVPRPRLGSGKGNT